MLLAEAGCVFMGFMLCFSGVQGRANSICALKGSSVDLPCSAEHPPTTMKWYKVQPIGSTFNLKNLPADDSHVKYMLGENNFNLTIKDLTERDAKLYCCSSKEDAGTSRQSEQGMIELHVADLQVKVIPSTEGHTVTLMCSSSCPLTENPAAYIWYKNREFLYEDWSPWYQQLVSSEEAVTYSCAIKGYEDLRAPQVSVDSVTSACFSVTYAKGRMCSYKQTSEDEPCSITYPTEVHVQNTPAAEPFHVSLTCNTSCPQTDLQTALRVYESSNSEGQYGLINNIVHYSSPESFSCAVKGLKDLHSAAVCAEDKNCWSVNYVSRRICAVHGSSVNISSEYSHTDNQQPQSKLWYKIIRSGKKETEKPIEVAGPVEYHENMNNHHILSIKDLTRNDSAEYKFKIQTQDGWKQSDFSGVTLVVTDLKVTFTPSAVVTEGQRVTLTCRTSCPLNTDYIWTFNSRPLNLPESQNKHLVLDPVSSQHEGRYSCKVKTGRRTIGSAEKTLTVQNTKGKQTSAAAAGVCAALLVLLLLTVLWWMRKKRTSTQSPRTEPSDNSEEPNPDSCV
ncbi:B-cell receptor CD22-like [Sparus aurata]|uniref:B-cell receptor CD22-like n=1 Tax=Sparus aurata TaxID=8175 RepID=UPI0011C10FCF|nr:B-cell receptor CD22-like [Sparus aurata]